MMSGFDEWQTDPSVQVAGFEHAAGFSTIGWSKQPKRGNLCKAKNNTCKGRRAKGTDYCQGHLNQMAAKEKPE